MSRRNLRLLVYGGRAFGDPDRGRNSEWEEERRIGFEALDKVHRRRVIRCVIGGEARGADQIGKEWALTNHVEYLPFPALWDDLTAPGAVVRYRNGKAYNANAGFDRNRRMRDEGQPTAAVEFPGGCGTAHMRGLLDGREIPVWEPCLELVR